MSRWRLDDREVVRRLPRNRGGNACDSEEDLEGERTRFPQALGG